MENEGTPAQTVTGTAAPATPAMPEPKPGEDWKAMSTEQFNARLAKEREASTKALLKELGFGNVDEAKAFVPEAKKRAEAEKSELQRHQERIKALEPVEKRAKDLETTIKKYLTDVESAIPADKRALLELAPSEEQPEARLDWLSRAQKQGLFSTPAVAAPVVPAATPTPKAANTIAPAGPSAPQPIGTLTPAQQYEALAKVNRALAANFYAANRQSIEAERSKKTS